MSILSENLPETTTGVTVSRYCASSLDAIRHASNAIKNGEGDAYVAAGIEFVSRFNERSEAAGVEDRNEKLTGEHDGYPNVYIDTSAYKPSRYPPELVAYLKTHGRRKVLFGSNYPMIQPADCLRELDLLGLDEETRRLFLSENAARVFGLR